MPESHIFRRRFHRYLLSYLASLIAGRELSAPVFSMLGPLRPMILLGRTETGHETMFPKHHLSWSRCKIGSYEGTAVLLSIDSTQRLASNLGDRPVGLTPNILLVSRQKRACPSCCFELTAPKKMFKTFKDAVGLEFQFSNRSFKGCHGR